MGDIDIETKDYMRDPNNFADAFNYYLFKGEEIIDPATLTELDTTVITIPYNTEKKTRKRIQKFRDVLKLWAAMEDDKAVYAVLGVENETNINYAEPVKIMLYDAIQYSMQVEEILSTQSRGQGGTFLYGLAKGEKIKPVITLVIHFGYKKWDGPKNLHEMLDIPSKEWKKYIPNYRLNLISASTLKETDLPKFHTNLGNVLWFIQICKDKKLLEQYAEKLPKFTEKEAGMLSAITNLELKYEVKEGKVDMCEAIRQMRQESEAKGEERGTLKTLAALVRDGILTLTEAAKRANMTVQEFEKKTGLKPAVN